MTTTLLLSLLSLSMTVQATPTPVGNFEFTWGGYDPLLGGTGKIFDLEGNIPPFEVSFSAMSADPTVPVFNWITSLASSGYSFTAIDLYGFHDGTYYTSVGKGDQPPNSGDNVPWAGVITFLGVGFEVDQVSMVPEPAPFTLLAAGLMAVGLTTKKKTKTSRQG